ncbi:hypothetical protein A4G29_01420 [Mycobacterium kansasii]|nr:hypothetical protein A4G29_01420 [Mycobacterium kansasii]
MVAGYVIEAPARSNHDSVVGDYERTSRAIAAEASASFTWASSPLGDRLGHAGVEMLVEQVQRHRA